MKTISMLELRQDAKRIIRQLSRGQRMVLTYRGKPVARPEPLHETTPAVHAPFHQLADLAVDEGSGLTNKEIDKIVYGL